MKKKKLVQIYVPICTHTQSKDLPHCQSRSQSSAEGRWWLTDRCQHNSWYPIRARHQLQLEPMGRGGKLLTQLWGPQIPVCPSFPLPCDQIPYRSVWICRAVPRMLSRRHTTLALSLLARLDYSLTAWSSERNCSLSIHSGSTFWEHILACFMQGFSMELACWV